MKTALLKKNVFVVGVTAPLSISDRDIAELERQIEQAGATVARVDNTDETITQATADFYASRSTFQIKLLSKRINKTRKQRDPETKSKKIKSKKIKKQAHTGHTKK